MGVVYDQKGSFKWLRWVLVLPAALGGAVIVIAFFGVLDLTIGSWTNYLFRRLSNQPPVTEVLPLALVPVAFVLAGLKTAPKQSFFVGSCLTLIGGLLNFCLLYICIAAVYGNRSIEAHIVEYVLGTFGSVLTIYLMRWTKKGKIKNKSLIWIFIGYILFAIMLA